MYFTLSTHTEGYPPLNLFREGDKSVIELAVAGFSKDQITVSHDEKRGVITIAGERGEVDETGRTYYSRRIAGRKFVRQFETAESLVITDVTLLDGILTVTLIPDEQKVYTPRVVQPENGEGKAAD